MKKEGKKQKCFSASLIIHPDELSKKWIDRMAAGGVKTLAIHPVGGELAHLTLAELLKSLESESFRELLSYAEKRGLGIEYEMHAMRYLLPESEFEAHSDWFRMDESGKRTTKLNFCASNKTALEYVSESAAQLAKKLYGSTDRYFFWLDDGKGTACHCPKCRRLSASDQQLIILNGIIKRIREDDPKATLAYLAYCDTVEPPITVKPEDGIFLEYAPYERDFQAPIEGNSQSDTIPALLEFFGKRGARVLDYWYDNSFYSKYKKPPAPFVPNKAVIKADIDYYLKLGFDEIAAFACYLGSDYEAMYGEADFEDLFAYTKEQT